MEQPEFMRDGSCRVCLLQRSLYGLRQAPRIWHNTLVESLQRLGFRQCCVDAGVYLITRKNFMMYSDLYVGGVLVVSTYANFDWLFDQFKAKFDLKSLGNVQESVGMEIQRKDNLLTI